MRNLIVTGNLVADPEEVKNDNGSSYYRFRIANNEFGGKGREEDVMWITVMVHNEGLFGRVKALKKGSRVIIIGRYRNGIFARKDGTNSIDNTIFAESIEFNGSGNKSTSTDNTGATAAPAPAPAPAAKASAPKASTVSSTLPLGGDDDLPF